MLTSYLAVYQTWVFAKNTSEKLPVARFVDFVINPETGIFEAIWVETLGGIKLVLPKDILEWTDEEIWISDENEIVKAADLPRLKKTLDKEVAILGADVFSGKNIIGQVSDFAFDTISPRILGITCKSGFWIFGDKRIISKNQITKITKKGILVAETKIKTPEVSKSSNVKGKIAELGEQTTNNK